MHLVPAPAVRLYKAGTKIGSLLATSGGKYWKMTRQEFLIISWIRSGR